MTIKSTKHYEKVSCPGKWLIGLFAGMLACGMNSQLQAQDYSDLIISEYVEGSGNNKAIEIYNGTGESVSLDDYVIRIAQNGNDFNLSDNNQGLYSKLSGSLANGETYVIISNAGGSAAPNQELTDLAQLKSAAVAAMNGDDAIGLFKGETLVDVVGISEKNNKILEDVTLRRLPGFGPNTTFTMEEWEKAEKDDFSDLGSFEATPSTDPSLSLQPSSLSLKAEVDATDEGTMVVSGRNLTEDVKVALSGDDAAMFSLSAATLSAAELMADGIELTITYAPTAEGSHTATLTFSNEEVNKTATIKGSTESQQEEGSYPTLASLYDLYDTEIPTEAITIAGDVVVTWKDSYSSRVWVQDIDQKDGGSMLLFKCPDFSSVNVGDVISKLNGKLQNYHGLLELTPDAVDVTASGHEVYTQTVSLADLDVPNYQSALVKIENVSFSSTGIFEATKYDYIISDGNNEIRFWATFTDADYIDTEIPQGALDITGIISYNWNNVTITARSSEDLATAGPNLNVASSIKMEAVTGDTTTATITVRGSLLTEDVSISFPEGNFFVSETVLDADSVMRPQGASFVLSYNGAKESESVAITLKSGDLSKTVNVTASASSLDENTFPNLAACYDLYNEDIDPETVYTIAGDVVVTHKDDYNTRIYVQDADMTNGASMLLFRAEDYGYAELQAGDVIKNLTGTMEVFNGLLEFKPTETLTASAHDHEIHITDATVAEINADPVAYQSALIRVKNVSFEESGEFALTENGRGVNYSLLQGEDILVFRTEFADADYIGTAIPERSLDITGIMTQYNEDAQLSARSLADIVPADTTGSECEAPSNLQVECTTRPTDPYFDTYEYNAHFTWEGSASAYLFMVIQSSDTVQMDTVTDTFADITIAEVKWVITRGEWAVASICEDGSLAWSETLPFEITENQTMEAMDVRLYPNPTSGRFYLETDRDARVEVFSANGSLIESQDLNTGLNEMNLRQKGVYFVRVSNGKASTVKRVVVR